MQHTAFGTSGIAYDPQGSTVSRHGSASWETARIYDAYGKVVYPVVPAGSLDEGWGESYFPFWYKGQAGYISDPLTGLVYCHYRYYDPNMGRWITRDPIGLEGGINPYCYCGNNPVMRADPSGLDWNEPGSLVAFIQSLFVGPVIVADKMAPRVFGIRPPSPIGNIASINEKVGLTAWAYGQPGAFEAAVSSEVALLSLSMISGASGLQTAWEGCVARLAGKGMSKAAIQFAQNKIIGKAGESALQTIVGKTASSQVRYSTTLGQRILDFCQGQHRLRIKSRLCVRERSDEANRQGR